MRMSRFPSCGIAKRSWTADARPHPAVTRTLKFVAETAARRRGGQVSAMALQARWKHEITVAIMRRRAAMARAVLPKMRPREIWLLTGHTEATASSDARSPELDDEAGGESDGEQLENVSDD